MSWRSYRLKCGRVGLGPLRADRRLHIPAVARPAGQHHACAGRVNIIPVVVGGGRRTLLRHGVESSGSSNGAQPNVF